MYCPKDIYERSAAYDEHVDLLRLRPYEWEFLLALDGRATLIDIGRRLNVDDDFLAAMIADLENRKLIAPRLLTRAEYRAEFEEEPASPQESPRLSFTLRPAGITRNEPQEPARPQIGFVIK